MPIATITGISKAGITCQWFSEEGGIKHLANILWEAIRCATVFKRDFFTHDLICLQLMAGDDIVEFDEDDANWADLVKAMPEYLFGCRRWDDWFIEVAFPAFEIQVQIIFKK